MLQSERKIEQYLFTELCEAALIYAEVEWGVQKSLKFYKIKKIKIQRRGKCN